jgi:multiple sugar transport system permease protein
MKIMKKNISFGRILIYILLLFGAFMSLLPFAWMLTTSLKTMAESTQIPPTIIPNKVMWSNYVEVFKLLPFEKYFMNTLISTVIIVVGQLLFCSTAGYAFARLKFWGKSKIFVVFLTILMVPGQIYLIPQYLIIQKLGLLNSIPALVLPGLFSAFGTFLLKQFFEAVPKELEEAAIIDGCNPVQIYWNVMMPLMKPALITLTILTALYGWNSLMWPLIINTSSDKMTLSAGIASLAGQRTTNVPIMMAGSLIAMLPMVAFFMAFQKKFIEGIAATGSKG